jgi:hypothetical protein
MRLEANSRVPCDTPLHPVDELKNSQDGIFAHLDFSTLSPEYASKKGIFAHENAGERAKQVRKWLRSRDEDIIVGASMSHFHLRQWGNANGSGCAW